MFVVRRSFRNYNHMILPGSIVEPGTVKWFKTRLRDRYIIEVTEDTIDQWDAYFMAKFKVSIKEVIKSENSTSDEEPEAPKEQAPEPEAPKEQAPEPVKKVVVAAVSK